MSHNRKANLVQELNDLRRKFTGSQVWLLIGEFKLQEFKTILSADYEQIIQQFNHVESVQQDMSLYIVECLFGRVVHDTKPADDYVEILFSSSSCI